MRIATYNVNGVNGRLSVLLRWLKEEQPDIACLQELRTAQERFPQAEIAKLGYQAVWHGQKSWNGVAILARNATPIETRRGLPGDPADLHSRYIEAQVGDILVGCIYLPNGNPAPGPKFEYKLAWFRRLNAYARTLLKTARPVVLCGDYNAVPTDLDAHKPDRWVGDAVFFPETKDMYRRLIAQGWTDALREMHPGRGDLHLLGLLSKRLHSQRWASHGPPFAESGPCTAAHWCRCRQEGAQLGENQRSRAHLGRIEGT